MRVSIVGSVCFQCVPRGPVCVPVCLVSYEYPCCDFGLFIWSNTLCVCVVCVCVRVLINGSYMCKLSELSVLQL